MSMQRDDFSGLPALDSGTIFTHVNSAHVQRSLHIRRWFGLDRSQPRPASADVIPLNPTESVRAARGLQNVPVMDRSGPDCIRYAV